MSATAHFEIQGLERVRFRFVEMLGDRKTNIAQYALAAWDGKTAAEINANLDMAKGILHQIAGSAGTVGFPDLGTSAHECETDIIAHLEGPHADLAVCPENIIWRIDSFVAACGDVSA